MGTIRTLAPSDRTFGRYQVRNQIAFFCDEKSDSLGVDLGGAIVRAL
jgi:hypothetical protein